MSDDSTNNTNVTENPPTTQPETLIEKVEGEVQKIEHEILPSGKKVVLVAEDDLARLRATLIGLGHMAKDDAAVTDEKVLAAAGQLLVMYNTVLRDATTMMQHTISVYESMTNRLGMIPDELNKTSVVFKAREGWSDLKRVVAASVQFFHRQDGTPPNVQVKSDNPTPPQPPADDGQATS